MSLSEALSHSQSDIAAATWYAVAGKWPVLNLDESFNKCRLRVLGPLPVLGTILRALFNFWYSSRSSIVILMLRRPETALSLLLMAVLRPRSYRVVLILEFTPPSALWRTKKSLRGELEEAALKWALPRLPIRLHVLSNGEKDVLSRRYDVDASRVDVVLWPMKHENGFLPITQRCGRRVICAGRFYCDWDTVIRAALNQNWDLVLVCSQSERSVVESKVLEIGVAGVTVISSVPTSVFREILASSDICVVSVDDVEVSVGQIRISEAICAGVPIIATNVPGVRDYIAHGRTGYLFSPGDWRTLGCLINDLLDDRALAKSLAENAQNESNDDNRARYLSRVLALIND